MCMAHTCNHATTQAQPRRHSHAQPRSDSHAQPQPIARYRLSDLGHGPLRLGSQPHSHAGTGDHASDHRHRHTATHRAEPIRPQAFAFVPCGPCPCGRAQPRRRPQDSPAAPTCKRPAVPCVVAEPSRLDHRLSNCVAWSLRHGRLCKPARPQAHRAAATGTQAQCDTYSRLSGRMVASYMYDANYKY